MNAMELFTAPLAQAIGWALLHLLWQATIVAAILATVLALLRRHTANVRYTVSCAALMLVFAMFVGTAWRAYEPAPAPMAPSAVSAATAAEMVPVTQLPILLAAAATESWRDRALSLLAAAQQSLPSVVAIWLAGVVVLSSRLLVSWARARRLAQGAVEASAQWQRIASRLSAALGLRRAVRLVESAAVEVPSVIGSLRPIILIPASALTGMTPEQIAMVLAHELAHIRRHDFFVNLLQAMVETLMFYHPAVWWMSRRVRIERENCCDDLAVAVCGNPLQYARALTRLEELRSQAPVIAVAANGGSLLDRIRRLVAERAESTASTSRWAAAVAMLSVVVIALAVPSLPALADRDEPKKKEEVKATSKVDVVAEPAEEPESEDADYEDDLDLPVVVPATAVAPRPAVVAVPAGMPVAPAPHPTPMPAPRMRMRGVPAPMTPTPPMRVRGVSAPMIAPTPPPAGMAALMAMDFQEGDDENERRGGRRDSGRKFGTSGKLTVDELIQLRTHGVTPEYVEQMRAVFPNLTLGDVSGLRVMGVTPACIRDLRAAGVKIENASEASNLAAMGVSVEFVKKLAAAGYDNLSTRELVRLAAAGVDGDFIREMSKYRDKN